MVKLRSGALGIRSGEYDEICHPGVGPRLEAEALYVRGLDLPARMASMPAGAEFVVWDVGLGGAANAATVIQSLAGIEGRLRLVSFDRQLDQLAFSLGHAGELGYFGSVQSAAATVLDTGTAEFGHGRLRVQWSVEVGDFPTRLAMAPREAWPVPHAVIWDPHSPPTNAEMWTLPLFRSLHARLDPACPCSLATYTRSTAVRVALLLAGFRVGAGASTATKEDSTLAANRAELLAAPLGERWLERVYRSHAAEPWSRPPFEGLPLSESSRRALLAHPQFTEAQVRPG